MDIFQNFQRGYHYLILDQIITTHEKKITKGVHLPNIRLKLTMHKNYKKIDVF